jgi:hypothetical protein
LWKQELKDFVRPHHACESVVIGRKLIADSLGIVKGDPRLPLLRATCAAIAHHHTTSAHEYGTTQLSPAATAAVEAALRNVRREGKWSYDIQQLQLHVNQGDLFRETAIKGQFTKSDLTDEQHRYETWLAYLITRALRLADQRADTYIP